MLWRNLPESSARVSPRSPRTRYEPRSTAVTLNGALPGLKDTLRPFGEPLVVAEGLKGWAWTRAPGRGSPGGSPPGSGREWGR